MLQKSNPCLDIASDVQTGKMVKSTVKYKALASNVADENESDGEDDDDEEKEGAINIHFSTSLDGSMDRQAMRRASLIRILVDLVFLGVVFGFVVYEWNGSWSPGLEQGLDKTHNHGEVDNEDDEDHNHNHVHKNSLYHHAAVLTDSAICSEIGKELLLENGNVVDAGIAALLCLGVVHPHTAGLGGVFTAVLYNNTTASFKHIHDSSQKFPSYGIPALLQGLKRLHSNYGTLEWARLFTGAIRLAKDGFVIDGILSRALDTHKDKILQSRLCDLFCDTSGGMKSEGALVASGNLSQLLLSVSLNGSHFPEYLAIKLAEDISDAERPAFLAAAQASAGEINEPLIVAKDKNIILSASSQLTNQMLFTLLDRSREKSLTFQNQNDPSNDSYHDLLHLANEILGTGLGDELIMNPESTLVGALDSRGNCLVIVTSLNSTWGSGQILPSSGVILNDFTSSITPLPYFSFPLVIRIKHDEELQFLAVNGGLSALLQAVVLLRNLEDFGMSAQETMNSPVLRVEAGGLRFLSGCASAVTNGSIVSSALSEGDGRVREEAGCVDDLQVVLLQMKTGHVGVYGAPANHGHSAGY